MRWLYKLENKIGRFHISNLMKFIVGGMVVVFVVNAIFSSQFHLIEWLSLDRSAIFSGQVWRLITFIFVPPSSSYFWIFISLYFYYFMGSSLEEYWGSFRFNVYYLLGILGAIISCMITGYASNTFLNLSLFLAFATIAPNTEFRIFFLIPVKAKWLALLDALFYIYTITTSFMVSIPFGLQMLVLLGFSLLNYFVFFGRTLIEAIREQIRIAKNRRNWRNLNR